MKREFRWGSPAGRAVVDRLDAWGEKERLEANGGLALASGTGGSGRGKPGDIGRISTLSVDVDLTLREWGVQPGPEGERGIVMRLLRFIWRDGREEVLVGRDYQLKGGDVEYRTDREIERGEIPGRYVASVDRFEKVSTYDLAKFPDLILDAHLRSMWPDLSEVRFAQRRFRWLESLHRDFAALMALRRGLNRVECTPLLRKTAQESGEHLTEATENVD